MKELFRILDEIPSPDIVNIRVAFWISEDLDALDGFEWGGKPGSILQKEEYKKLEMLEISVRAGMMSRDFTWKRPGKAVSESD